MSLSEPDAPAKPNWLPWVLPMVVFLVLTSVEGRLPRGQYPILYMVKAAVVTGALIWSSRAWRRDLKFNARAVGIGALAGLFGLGLWLGLDMISPELKFLGKRVAYDPFQEIPDAGLRSAFLAVRFLGLAVLVPVLEEVFWRGFALRFLTDMDRWESLAHGAFNTVAFFLVAIGFTLGHPEWLPAFAYAALTAFVLRYTKSLLACVVCHAVTNAALGIYVLSTANWRYW